MVNNPQSSSPVISPRTSTAGGVFSQVRDLVGDRLDHTVSGVNRVPHLIAASRASLPQAHISNEQVAEVSDYSPLPGHQMARHMRLDMQNNPGRQVDQVIDAIQRYLNIEPRREPTADPKAEDSIVRHPQQIIQSSQRWNDATYYQFATNGAESYQFRPEYRAWGGGLELKLENEGSANIFAPSSSSPQPGASPLGQTIAADPARAAQETMTQLTEMFNEADSPGSLPSRLSEILGLPAGGQTAAHDPARAAQESIAQLAEIFSPTETPAFLPNRLSEILELPTGGWTAAHDPARAAQESMARMRDMLGGVEAVEVGIPAMPMSGDLWDENSILGEYVTHEPVRAAQDSMAQLQGMLGEAARPTIALPPMMTDNPYFDPSTAANNASRYIRQLLSGAPLGEREIGGGNFSDDPAFSPANAWRTALSRADENLGNGGAPQPPVLVGPPSRLDDPLNAPDRAWSTTTVVGEGLAAATGNVIGDGRAAEFRPRGYDQAYVRVMRIIDELNIGRFPSGGAWNQQT
jgi:hypothetical protein